MLKRALQYRPNHRRLAFEPLEDRSMLATITVTSLADNLTVDGQVTLREAIRAAELNISIDGSLAGSDVETDTIEFATGGDIDLAVVDDTVDGPTALLVTSPIIIQGHADGTTIGRDSSLTELRLFRVTASGDLTFESINLTGGRVRGTNGSGPGINGGVGKGGAILNEGTLQIVGSTLNEHQARGGDAGAGAAAGPGLGGALFNDNGNVAIVNATFSGNAVLSGAGTTVSSLGGAIYGENGTYILLSSTITSSTATTGRGLYLIAVDGTVSANLQNNIIGQSDTSINLREFIAAPDEQTGGLTITGANNLIRSQNDFQSITVVDYNVDPMLGPLADNGGPTLTHALLASSPAINSDVTYSSLGSDQRGVLFSRVVGGKLDIGAFEFAIAGDFDRSGSPGAADYVLWRQTSGDIVPPYSGADSNGDTNVDGVDYNTWRGNFGTTLPAAVAAFAPVGETSFIEAAPRIDATTTKPLLDAAFALAETPTAIDPPASRFAIRGVFNDGAVSDQNLLLALSPSVAIDGSPVVNSVQTATGEPPVATAEAETIDAVMSTWAATLDVVAQL